MSTFAYCVGEKATKPLNVQCIWNLEYIWTKTKISLSKEALQTGSPNICETR